MNKDLINFEKGFGFSAMWPAIFAFAEEYIKLTNVIGTIFCFASGIFPIISPFVLGDIQDHPIVFIFVEIFYLSLSLLLFIIMLFIAKRSNKSNIQHVIIINH
jgi:fucose permease